MSRAAERLRTRESIWRGRLRIERGALVYGMPKMSIALVRHPGRFHPEVASLRFEPRGVVVSAGGERVDELQWERCANADVLAGAGSWSVEHLAIGGPRRPGGAYLVRGRGGDAPATWVSDVDWDWAPRVAIEALCSWLRDEPRARPQLADRHAIAQLLADLDRWDRQPAPPGESIISAQLGVHLAVERELRRHDPHRYSGRPVGGWSVPDPEALTAAVAFRMSEWDETDTATIDNVVARWLAVSPWPFAALRG